MLLLEHHGIPADSVDMRTVLDALWIPCSDGWLSRENAVTAIIRSYGVYPVGEVDHIWSDEAMQTYRSRVYIDYGRRVGIIAGVGDNMFLPLDPVTRDDFNLMLAMADEAEIFPAYPIEYDDSICMFLSADIQRGMSLLPVYVTEKFLQSGWRVVATTHPLQCDGVTMDSQYIGCIIYAKKTIWIATYTADGCSHLRDTTIHEFGHYLGCKTKIIPRGRVQNDLEWLISRRGRYCDTNDSEYFADAFVEYITCPILAKSRMRDTYMHITECLGIMNDSSNRW